MVEWSARASGAQGPGFNSCATHFCPFLRAVLSTTTKKTEWVIRVAHFECVIRSQNIASNAHDIGRGVGQLQRVHCTIAHVNESEIEALLVRQQR